MTYFVVGKAAVPLVLLVVYWGMHRSAILPARVRLTLATTIAFVVGYGLLPGAFIPERYWHWLPYVATASAVIASLTHGRVFWLAQIFIAIVAAWLIVPTWSNLEPSRLSYGMGLAIYFVALPVVLKRILPTERRRSLLLYFAISATAIAVLIAALISLTLAELSLVAATGLWGAWIVAVVYKVEHQEIEAWLPTATIMLVGVTFVGHIDPQPPKLSLLLLPLSLLVIGLCRPTSKPDGMSDEALAKENISRWRHSLTIFLAVLGLLVAFVLWSDGVFTGTPT